MKEIASSIVSGNPPNTGPYLLFANGENVDFELLERELSAVEHFQLGPFCWLIILRPAQGIFQFSEAVSMALPPEDGKAELLLCHLDRSSIAHGNAGGVGLVTWLKKNGYYSSEQ